MDAQIVVLKPMKVAFVRHVGPYNEVGNSWQQLCAWAGRNGLLGANTKTFGICHDDPEITPPEQLRYDACIVIGSDGKADGDIGVQEIAGGRYAKATHQGPYTKLGDTYSELLGQWMPAHGFELVVGKPTLEFYRNNPQQTPEDELRTDIHVPFEGRVGFSVG